MRARSPSLACLAPWSVHGRKFCPIRPPASSISDVLDVCVCMCVCVCVRSCVCVCERERERASIHTCDSHTNVAGGHQAACSSAPSPSAPLPPASACIPSSSPATPSEPNSSSPAKTAHGPSASGSRFAEEPSGQGGAGASRFGVPVFGSAMPLF